MASRAERAGNLPGALTGVSLALGEVIFLADRATKKARPIWRRDGL